MKVRTGDTVFVIAGNDRGRTGVVQRIDRARQRVVVEGINMRWKHKKPTQKNPKGERTQIEVSIHASNVMHVGADNKPTRREPERTEQKNQRQKQQKQPSPKQKRKS